MLPFSPARFDNLAALAGRAAAYPMDAYASAGIAFFSTRRLLTTLAKAEPVRFRNATTNEADIAFAADGLDVSAAARSALLGSGNGFLTAWYDQLNGRNAVQATTLNQPSVQVSGTPVTINSRQAAKGSGVAGARQDITVPSFAHGIGTGDFMVSFITTHTVGSIADNGLLSFGSYAPSFYTRTTGANNPVSYFGAYRVFSTSLTNGTTYVITFTRESGVLKCYVNGTLDASSFAVATSIPTSTITLFNEEAVGGLACSPNPTQEILIFNSVANRAAIIANQMTHAGL